MELSGYCKNRKEAVDNAAEKAAAIFEKFRWEVVSVNFHEFVVPDVARIRSIINALVDAAENSFKEDGGKNPVRVASARMNVVIWPTEDGVSYQIGLDLSAWDVFSGSE